MKESLEDAFTGSRIETQHELMKGGAKTEGGRFTLTKEQIEAAKHLSPEALATELGEVIQHNLAGQLEAQRRDGDDWYTKGTTSGMFRSGLQEVLGLLGEEYPESIEQKMVFFGKMRSEIFRDKIADLVKRKQAAGEADRWWRNSGMA